MKTSFSYRKITLLITFLFLLLSNLSFSQSVNLLSINRVLPTSAITNESEFTFKVTFDQAVINLTKSDIVLKGVGASSHIIKSVDGPFFEGGYYYYNVTVSIFSGANGNLQMGIKGINEPGNIDFRSGVLRLRI